MRKGIILLIVFCWVLMAGISGQLSHGGNPLSIEHNLKATIPVVDISQLPLSLYMTADEPVSDNKKALIFAKNYDVYITPENNGKWMEHTAGYKIWTIGIHSPGAESLGLLFGDYHLTGKSRVYIFNSDRSATIGSLTSDNNKFSGVLPVAHLRGDLIYIQLEVPDNQGDYGFLEISKIAHGFDNGGPDSRLKDQYYGKSGACNIDINCPAGEDFQVIKRSVCRIIINTNKRCTGNLINNTSQDGKAYVLTAAHCISSQNEASSAIFLFNYESPECNGPDVPVKDMIAGATLLSTGDTLGESSNRDSLDFSLVELSLSPPDSFNVYFAGWNRSPNPPASSTTIHHPRGDVKKIAFDLDAPESSYHNEDYYPEYVLYSHWRITEWDSATTEFGSSGGALLDPQQRIIGLLTGGLAVCDNPVDDYFTKFDYSWNYYDDTVRSLKSWLDPLNTGVMNLDGAEIWTHVQPYEQPGLFVYPNPGNGFYTLEIPGDEINNLSLRVFDLSGKLVFQKQYDNTQEIHFNLSDKAPGIYIIHGVNADRVYTQKIIHQPYR
jgi:lysyl endopeptidase